MCGQFFSLGEPNSEMIFSICFISLSSSDAKRGARIIISPKMQPTPHLVQRAQDVSGRRGVRCVVGRSRCESSKAEGDGALRADVPTCRTAGHSDPRPAAAPWAGTRW